MKPNLYIFKDAIAVSQTAAHLFHRLTTQAIQERSRALVLLCGGNTPLGLYRQLAQPPFLGQIQWPRIHLFWGDERYVPLNDPESNYGQVREALIKEVPLDPQNIHPFSTNLQPEIAADKYARILRKYANPPLDWPRFDLVLLGLGEDGHTASIFPGSPIVDSKPALVVNANYQDRPVKRLTITPMVINSARQVIFLVTGMSKSKALASVMFGEYHPVNLPAQRIKPQAGEITWLVDQGAASRIS